MSHVHRKLGQDGCIGMHTSDASIGSATAGATSASSRSVTASGLYSGAPDLNRGQTAGNQTPHV